MMNETLFGSTIERGTVAEVATDGYRVKSDERDGIVTPVIKAVINKSHAVGDKVYFALFEDGDGIILN